jgi:hypothetical protein
MGPSPHDPDGIPARTPETAGATLEPPAVPARSSSAGPVPGAAEPAPVVRAEGTQTAAPAVPEEGSPGASGGSSLSSRLADAAAASAATAEGASSAAGAPSSEPAPAASGPLGGAPDGPLAPTSRAAIGGHRIPPATSTRGPPPALLPSAGGHNLLMGDSGFGFAAPPAARDASNRLPLPLPGAPPAPAPGGASSGSAPGGGPDLSGALALLLIAALAGRFLRHARDLLRPDSVYGPIVNQPS